MAKTSKSARRGMSQAIRHHIKDKGMSQRQAVAVAYKEQRERGRKVPAKKKSTGGKRKGQTKRSRAAQKAGRASARKRKRD